MTVYTAVQIEEPFKDCIAVIGMRQSGKTFLISNFLLKSNPHTTYIIDPLGAISKSYKPRPNQVIIRPKWNVLPDFKTRVAWLESVLEEIWKRGNCIVVIDEIHLFCTKYILPPKLANLVNQGGNKNIAIWFSSQRVSQVHNDVLAACKHHFIFKLYLPQDKKWYADVVTPEVVEQATKLQKYHFIYYKLGETPEEFDPI